MVMLQEHGSAGDHSVEVSRTTCIVQQPGQEDTAAINPATTITIHVSFIVVHPPLLTNASLTQ